MPASYQSAEAMRVHCYRQIFLLPVPLEFPPIRDDNELATESVQRWREAIRILQKGKWQKCDSLPLASTPPGDSDFNSCESTYEEAVYFQSPRIN